MKHTIALLLMLALAVPALAVSPTDKFQNNWIRTLNKTNGQQNHWLRALNKTNGQQNHWIRELRERDNNLSHQIAAIDKQFVAVDARGDVIGPAFLRVSNTPASPIPLIWIYLDEFDMLVDIRPRSSVLFTGLDCTGEIYVSATISSGASTAPAAFIHDGDLWGATGELETHVLLKSYFGISNTARWNGCVNSSATKNAFYAEQLAPWTFVSPIKVEMR